MRNFDLAGTEMIEDEDLVVPNVVIDDHGGGLAMVVVWKGLRSCGFCSAVTRRTKCQPVRITTTANARSDSQALMSSPSCILSKATKHSREH